jgi:MFS family permease
MSEFMGATPFQMVAWSVPMALGGLIICCIGGLIFHRVSGTILLIISSLGYIGSGLFFAVAPQGANYWAFVFPAMICGTIGIDISFNLANIFITTNMPKSKQGLAGALINCTLHLGIAVMLGFADIVHIETLEYAGMRGSYKTVFWFEVGLAVVGLLVVAGFVRVKEARSELTVDEREALAREAVLRQQPAQA